MELEFATRCIYGNKEKFEKEGTGAISFPIYQTATYAHPEVGVSTSFDYSRLQNPTREQLEKVVASLEKGIDALAFSSGMAAITALMEIFKPGDHIITEADLYGGSMEKVLFAADELTGLVWAAALMRPSKSTKDMELKSLKKKYKSKGFAAGCSREVIERGAEQLGWELDKLLMMTLQAMQATEDEINAKL